MSKTVDQRVVEMRFDNKQFESNVKTTMSTLDKLKQSLNLTGASKGLENVGTAAKKIDLSGVSAATETLTAKFSALQVMGVTALANITNSAVNAGKRMAKALTIDPVKTGLKEYETQINSTQTILANTESKGSTIDDVNRALEELNEYADLTIYNFTEMTRNIGTFTAAGVDLDTSVSAIKGIANLAAVSGSTSQQASTAMYQLSQALASGTVRLQDWNSVVNAGMGGEVFQNALKRTAKAMGTDVDALIEQYGSFRDSLTKGEWLTTDVLTETLNQFTMAAEEGSEAWNEYKKSLMDKGYTEEQALEILKMANTATAAATKVKTFTQLWDVLKESVQSGWAQTWKLIIGDFEEAKALLSPIADVLTGFIGRMSKARNDLLKGALGKNFVGVLEKIKKVTDPIKKSADSVKEVVKSVQDYANIVDEIIGGKWGTGQDRWNKLTESGYDWAHAQNLVNEKLGNATRHATEYKDVQEKTAEAQTKTAETTGEYISELVKLSDEQLRTKGYTNEQIKAFRELEQVADKTGIPIKEFVDNIDEIDGRYLLIHSFKNACSGLITIFKSIGEAWRDAFPPATADQLFNVIAGFHKFSTYLIVGEDTAEKLTRTLKGVFAILDVITTIAGSGLKIAFKVLTAVLKYFNMDILDLTANVGDALVKFRNWFDSLIDIDKVVSVLIPMIDKGAIAIKKWFTAFKGSSQVQAFVARLKESFEMLKSIDLIAIGKYVIEGFKLGLGEGIKRLVTSVIDLGKQIIKAFCNVFDIHSPSRVMIAIGGMVIAGLVAGFIQNKDAVLAALSGITSGLLTIVQKFIDFVKVLDPGAVIAVLFGTGMLVTALKFIKVFDKIANSFSNITSPLKAISSVVSDVGESFKKNLKAKAMKTIAEAMLIMAIAIGGLALIDVKYHDSLTNVLGVMTLLAVTLGMLAVGIGKWGPKETLDLFKIGFAMAAMASSILILAVVMKQMSGLETGIGKGLLVIGALGAVMVALMAATKLFDKEATKVGSTLLAISASMWILSMVMKSIAKMEWDDLAKCTYALGGLLTFIGILIIGTNLFGNNGSHVGGTLIKIAFAMGLMAVIVTLASKINPETLIKGAAATIVLGALIAGLIAATRLAGGAVLTGVSTTLIGIATAMGILTLIMYAIQGLTDDELKRGLLVIAALELLVIGLVAATNLVGKDIKGIATTLIGIAIAIGILALITVLMGIPKVETLAKGLIVVGILSLFVAGLIKATRGAADCKGSLIAMIGVIAALTVCAALLTMIPEGKLLPAAAGLSAMLVAFGIMAKLTSVLNVIQTPFKSLASLVVIVGLLATVLGALSVLPMDGCLEKATALSVLLLALSGSITILNSQSFMVVTPQMLTMLVTMTAVVAALAGVLALIKDLPIESTMANAASLSVLLLALSGACVILSGVGVTGAAGFVGVGVLATLVGAVAGLLVAIGALTTYWPEVEEFLNKGIPILEKIGYALGSFFGNIVGGFIDGAFLDRIPYFGACLSAFMTNVSGFVEGAKTVDASVLAGVGYLSGAIIALSAADFIQGLSSIFSDGMSLAAFGTDLSNFMTNASGFLEGVNSINESAANGAKALADTILALTASNVLDSIFSFGDNGDSLTQFANQLVPFGEAMVAFSGIVSGNIDEGAVTAAANAGKTISELQKELYGTGGFKQDIFGEKDLSLFGVQLGSFGRSIVAFSTIVAGNIDESAVTAAASAGKIMAELQSGLVGTGGVVQWFCGEKDLTTFGIQLGSFGRSIVAFSSIVSRDGAINEAAITAAATAGTIMTELQNKVVPTGGVVDFFTGTKDLAVFGTQIKTFGTAMADFSSAVDGKINDSAVNSATKIGYIMANIQKAIPEDRVLDGKKDLTAFGKDIKGFGEKMAEFSDEIVAVDVSAAETATSIARQLVNIIRSTASLDTSGVDTFTAAISKLAETNISGLVEAFNVNADTLKGIGTTIIANIVSGITSAKSNIAITVGEIMDTIRTAADNLATDMSTSGASLGASFQSGIDSKHVAILAAMNSVLDDMYNAVTKRYTDFDFAGSHVMTGLLKGIESILPNISTTITTSLDTTVTTANGYYDSFYNVGSNIVSGVVAGIDENMWRAEAKAAAMANAALEAAEEELGIASPSKEFGKVGNFAGMGFVNALHGYAKTAHNAGAEMAASARTGLQNAVGKLNKLISGEIETQPTIRPVLDLSAIRSDAGTIGDMLTLGSSANVLANVGSISLAMNRRSQNGTNDDVVLAINKLRKDLGNVGSTTYNVNGITYDDGSNISQAVKDLVRAARVERRV